MDDPALRDELLRLESALARRDPTGIEGGLMALVAEDFLEFGRSGRIWNADSIRDLLGGPSVSVEAATIEDFAVSELADGVALMTYRVSSPPAVNRSSIWVRRDGRWQIRFHQGTDAST